MLSFCIGYDNYPGYPYIDETPTTEPDTGYFGGENKPEYYGEAGGSKNGYFGGENELTVDGRRSVINGEIMAGECKYHFTFFLVLVLPQFPLIEHLYYLTINRIYGDVLIGENVSSFSLLI